MDEKTTQQPAETTGNMIAQEIRNGIISGRYKAGEKLKESELCNQFGVSRTPVREAFRLLQNEGILVHNPQRGVQIPYLGVEEVMNLQQVRVVLECMSVRNAAPHATEQDIAVLTGMNQDMLQFDVKNPRKREQLDLDFHMYIARIGKNPYVAELLQSVLSRYELSSYILPFEEERIPHTFKEHKDIIQALEMRDTELAGLYMDTHFRFSTISMSRKLQKYVEENSKVRKRKKRNKDL